ncbi:hypothetical protein P308_05745 [Pseudomonas piscis]|nr:hypothetical protein P308_05745 [Pseudomonas piscis]
MSHPYSLDVTREDAQAIDDCWNRIGIHGDKSCPLLAEHIHCRNCSVYSAAATRLLDRYSLRQQDRERSVAEETDSDVASRSLLMFRLGEEWLGLLPAVCWKWRRNRRSIPCRISVHEPCWGWPMSAGRWWPACR